MSHLCRDGCTFYSKTLAYDSSSNVTVQQSVFVKTLPDNSSLNVSVQQSVFVETLPDNFSSAVCFGGNFTL